MQGNKSRAGVSICLKIAGQRVVSFFSSFIFYAFMFFHSMLLQEWVVAGHRVAVAPGLQRRPGRILLQDPPSPLPLRPGPFHNLLHNRKAASGEV